MPFVLTFERGHGARRGRVLFARIVPCTAVAALLAFAAAVQARADSGRIAFVSGKSQAECRVSVLNLADGTVAPVGAGHADGAPVWSHDGLWLAYPSSQGASRVIRLVRPDGTQDHALNNAARWNDKPRWTAKGNRLAYVAGKSLADQHLVVYDLDKGSEQVWGGGRQGILEAQWLEGHALLAFLGAAQALNWGGVDIDSIAFDAGGKGMLLAVALRPGSPGPTTDLVLITSKAALTLPVQVMPSKGAYVAWDPVVSPNGHIVAFESNDGGDREIFVLTFTKGAFDVTNHRAADWNPVWAPDSRSMAFESFRAGHRGIYRVYPDTVRVSPIAVSKDADNWAPHWSPDGRRIVFVSDRSGDPELYECDASGENVRQLTHHPGLDVAPVWQPEPRP